MFLEYVKTEHKKGNIRVGLHAVGYGDKVYLSSSKFIPNTACKFLNSEEKKSLE